VIRDHFILMTGLAGLVSVFLAILWRETPREIVRLFFKIFLWLLGSAIVLGWLMYSISAR
jgi:NhaP-type Na+/H+ and K+/H+ antiporter